MTHLATEHFEERLPHILDSPKDNGVLKMIVIRPESDDRQILDSCPVSFEGGTHGDRWARGCWKSLPDGSPHPDVQIAIMNDRVLDLIADTDEARSLSGDNLFVDMDLSDENLRSGDRLKIADAVLEITDVPHAACRKFAEKFGKDAASYINSSRGKSLRLRGIYARVVVDGVVSVGDRIAKLEAALDP